jgi:hypothetical protein
MLRFGAAPWTLFIPWGAVVILGLDPEQLHVLPSNPRSALDWHMQSICQINAPVKQVPVVTAIVGRYADSLPKQEPPRGLHSIKVLEELG